MIELTSLPNDRRNFIHKRIIGGVTNFVTSGFNPLAAVGGFVASPASAVPTRARRSPVTQPRSSLLSRLGRRPAIASKFAQVGPPGQPFIAPQATFGRTDVQRQDCPGLFSVKNPNGVGCIDLRALPPGGRPALTPSAMAPPGDAVMGRFGAALSPGSRIVDRAVCLRGMVLGNDGLCYNSRGFRNSDRMWPKGRKPLLTGGEMRAISIASRAGKRLENTAIRLQEIGLIKKPVARRRSKKR